MSATSTYLEALPPAIAADPAVAGFMLAFERVLSGRIGPWAASGYAGDPLPGLVGIEQRIEGLPALFSPSGAGADGTPTALMGWLAELLGAFDRADLDEPTRRRMIAAAVPSFALRGTKGALLAALDRMMGAPGRVKVYEFEDVPHFFQVEITIHKRDPAAVARIDRIARALIDHLRPAHTGYGLRLVAPALFIDDTARDPESGGVWIDHTTLLGTHTAAPDRAG